MRAGRRRDKGQSLNGTTSYEGYISWYGKGRQALVYVSYFKSHVIESRWIWLGKTRGGKKREQGSARSSLL